MRIIIEGADGTGKSTVSNYLKEKYNLEYIHVNGNDPNTFEWYMDLLEKNNVIFDRHFIGEMIYPYIFDRKCNLSQEQFDILLKKTKELNYNIIIMTEKDNVILKRLHDRLNEDESVIKTLKIVNKIFRVIARRIGAKLYYSNTMDVLSQIDMELKK